MRSLTDRLAKGLFLLSVCMVCFLAGFIICFARIYPYNVLVTGMVELNRLVSDQPPWYYRKGKYNQGGVLTYDEASAYAGLNLVTSIGPDNRSCARLLDMKGKTLHEWNVDWFDVWPNPIHLHLSECPKRRPGPGIHGAVLMPNGDLVFNFDEYGMVRLDRFSNVVWRLPYKTHHSITLDHEGHFWVCGQKTHREPCSKYPNYIPPFREFTILEISGDGKILQEISVFDLLIKNELRGLLYMRSHGSAKMTGDTMHLNDVEPFPISLEEGFFKKTDLLLSLRNINTVLVFNRLDRKIKFIRTGYFVHQHDPDFIDGNTISVFDNNRIAPEARGYQSRILILTVPKATPNVYFIGTKEAPFYTTICGKHQWLPNGNLLISEGMKGRAFEIDRYGNVVWEYLNVVEEGMTGLVFEVQRVPLYFAKVFLDMANPQGDNDDR